MLLLCRRICTGTKQQNIAMLQKFSHVSTRKNPKPSKSIGKKNREKRQIIESPDVEGDYFKALLKLFKQQKEIPMIYTAHNSCMNVVNEELLKSLNLHKIEKKTTFTNMGINQELIDLLDSYEITKPYQPQEKSIPHIINGRNVIVESATGSGKTLSFLLPICNEIGEKSCSNVIVVPTRELATQVYKEFMKYIPDKVLVSRHVSGVNEEHDMNLKKALRYSKILIGTPKKLYDLIMDNPGYFRNTNRLVLDEVDKLLPLASMKTKNLQKVKPTEKILSMLKFHQKSIQLIATSATIPRDLVEELQLLGFGKYCRVIRLTPKEFPFGRIPSNIKHNFIQVIEGENDFDHAQIKMIARLFEGSNEKSALVFISRDQSVDKVLEYFKEVGLKAVGLYKELLHPTTKGFENFSEAFRCGDIDLVVSTEETMRGMDFPFVSQSYLTYIPDSPASYLHVAGRVGRSGQASTVTTLLSSSDWKNEKRRLKRKYFLLGVKGKLLVA